MIHFAIPASRFLNHKQCKIMNVLVCIKLNKLQIATNRGLILKTKCTTSSLNS